MLEITRVALWAMVAVTLITLNESVAVRVMVHLHLFKFGWALLAVWAFVAFAETAFLVAGAAAGVRGGASCFRLRSTWAFSRGSDWDSGLQSSLLAGRVGRRALAGTVVAALDIRRRCAVLFCFPVWTNYSPIVGSDQYFHRYWAETWIYGSEMWKYFVPKNSWLAANYFRDLRHKMPAPTMDEGWNFPGYTVVLAVLVAGCRLAAGVGGQQ